MNPSDNIPAQSEHHHQDQDTADSSSSSSSSSNIPPETRFFKYFQQELTALVTQIEKLDQKSQVGGERNDAIDHCLAGISRLSKEVKEASSYVPSYHQKIYADAIKALQDKLAETRAKLAPRPKFAFKNVRKRPSAMSLHDLEELNEQHARGVAAVTGNRQENENKKEDKEGKEEEATSHTNNDDPNSIIIIIKEKQHEYISTPENAAATSTTAYITDITSSIIDLSSKNGKQEEEEDEKEKEKHSSSSSSSSSPSHHPLATLSARNITDSILICGQITGPAHITTANNSVLVLVGCQQLRLHDCTNVDVYLSCGSRPIIEDCKGIRVARVPEFYKPSSPSSSSSPATADLWDQVQDFNWIKAEHSPNWKLLQDDKAVQNDEFWEKLAMIGKVEGNNEKKNEEGELMKEVLKTKMKMKMVDEN